MVTIIFPPAPDHSHNHNDNLTLDLAFTPSDDSRYPPLFLMISVNMNSEPWLGYVCSQVQEMIHRGLSQTDTDTHTRI